jgi:hypothetical protein
MKHANDAQPRSIAMLQHIFQSAQRPLNKPAPVYRSSVDRTPQSDYAQTPLMQETDSYFGSEVMYPHDYHSPASTSTNAPYGAVLSTHPTNEMEDVEPGDEQWEIDSTLSHSAIWQPIMQRQHYGLQNHDDIDDMDDLDTI